MNDFQYYRQLSFEELITDPEFRRWVFSPSEASDKYWRGLTKKYPETSKRVEEARSFLLSTRLHFEVKKYSIGKIEENLKKVIHRRDLEQGNRLLVLRRKLQALPAAKWWMIAACGLLVAAITIWTISGSSNDLIYKTNFGQWEVLSLPDGTSVHLNANSKLTLGKDWSEGSVQKVWLEGEAFFRSRRKNFR